MVHVACIAGIGESAVGQVPDRSTLQLQTDAARAALSDAGLTFDDIDGLRLLAESGAAHPQFESPYGPLIPSNYALIAQRHMHEYGTTEEQMAEVAVTIRRHASFNPNAHQRKLITIEDVMASPMITSPLKRFDCALVSDGAAAAIVTTRERARDAKKKPVYLLGQGYGLRHSYVGEAPDLTTCGAVESGRKAFETAGVTHADIDVAQLYDCFTITVIIELEDLGLKATQRLKQLRPDVTLVIVEGASHTGPRGIQRHPQLVSAIREFIARQGAQ